MPSCPASSGTSATRTTGSRRASSPRASTERSAPSRSWTWERAGWLLGLFPASQPSIPSRAFGRLPGLLSPSATSTRTGLRSLQRRSGVLGLPMIARPLAAAITTPGSSRQTGISRRALEHCCCRLVFLLHSGRMPAPISPLLQAHCRHGRGLPLVPAVWAALPLTGPGAPLWMPCSVLSLSREPHRPREDRSQDGVRRLPRLPHPGAGGKICESSYVLDLAQARDRLGCAPDRRQPAIRGPCVRGQDGDAGGGRGKRGVLSHWLIPFA